MVLIESSIRDFLGLSVFVVFLPALTQAAQLLGLLNTQIGPCPCSLAGALCIPLSFIIEVGWVGFTRRFDCLNKALTRAF